MPATHSEVCRGEKGGRPAVKTPCFQCFHCQGAQFDPWSNRETKMLHAMGMAKREREAWRVVLRKRKFECLELRGKGSIRSQDELEISRENNDFYVK